jgi:hypothetical protein
MLNAHLVKYVCFGLSSCCMPPVSSRSRMLIAARSLVHFHDRGNLAEFQHHFTNQRRVEVWFNVVHDSSHLHFKNVVLPRRHIQIDAAGLKVVPVAFVLRITEQIPEPPLAATKVGERKADVTLALVTGESDGDEQPPTVGALSRKCDERVVRAVAIPRGRAFGQPPFAIADRRAAEHFEALRRHRFKRRPASRFRSDRHRLADALGRRLLGETPNRAGNSPFDVPPPARHNDIP